jgi:hypothetical protein
MEKFKTSKAKSEEPSNFGCTPMYLNKRICENEGIILKTKHPKLRVWSGMESRAYAYDFNNEIFASLLCSAKRCPRWVRSGSEK